MSQDAPVKSQTVAYNVTPLVDLLVAKHKTMAKVAYWIVNAITQLWLIFEMSIFYTYEMSVIIICELKWITICVNFISIIF